MEQNRDPLPRAPTVPVRLRLAGCVLRAADADPAAPPDGPAVYRLEMEQWRWYRQDPEPSGAGPDAVRHWLVLPDGSEIAGGRAGRAAIRGLRLEESVNDDGELTPGAACAAAITATLWVPAGQGPGITAGTELACWRRLPGREPELLGLFTAEQPTRATANTFTLTAYDRMIRTDVDLSPWLRENQALFPMPLLDFARAVCAQCGVTLENGTLPNGEMPVGPFYADGLTGRRLLQWVGEAAGRFCRATPQGTLRFAWYAPGPPGRGITPGGGSRPTRLRLAGRVLRTADADPLAPPDGPAVYRLGVEQIWYHADSLHYEEYAAAPITGVTLRAGEKDTGVSWPPGAPGENPLVLTGNPLLENRDTAVLQKAAQTLFTALGGFSYTPCRVTVPSTAGLRAGMTVPVCDAQGRRFTACIMRCALDGISTELESSGGARRDTATAVTNGGLRNLRGKVLEIESGVDGLTVTAQELAGAQSRLRQTVESMELSVENGEKRSVLTLNADGAALSSAAIEMQGVVTFSELETPGKTTICGSNITTGTIQSKDGRNVLDLDNGTAKLTGEVNATSGSFSSVTIGGATITGSSFAGTLNSPGGSYVGSISSGGTFTGTHSGGSLSSTGGSFTGTASSATLRSCTTGGTSLTVAGGSLSAHNSYTAVSSGGIVYIHPGNAYHTFNGANFAAPGNISCDGTKSRAIRTAHYGVRELDALETPLPTFADYGTGCLDENGVCTVAIDPVFAETVAADTLPTVLLTPYGQGALWLDSDAVEHGAFTVRGAPGLAFAWQACWPQANAYLQRLRTRDFDQPANPAPDYHLQADLANEQAALDYARLGDEFVQQCERSYLP